MRIQASILIYAAALAIPALAADEWTMRKSSDPNKAYFSITRRDTNNRWNSSSDVPWTAFKGISAAQLDKNQTGVKFEMVRDAGRIICEGQTYNGSGLGSFTFEPNQQYAAELAKLGYEKPATEELFTMTMMDVSLEFARGVKSAGLNATTRELTELRIHGTTLDYIKEIRSLGYTDLNARNYIEMRIHGVQPDFLRYLKSAGYNPTAREAIELKIHGVDPDLLKQLKAAGYNVSLREAVELRIHGVTPEYIQELNGFGFKPTARELVDLRIHGVTTDFIKQTRGLGYQFDAKQLTAMRIHGVDAAYLKKLQAAGYKNLTADQIQQLRIHGID